MRHQILAPLFVTTVLASACGGTKPSSQDTGIQANRSLETPADCAVNPNSMLLITRASVVNDATRTQWTGSTSSLPDGAWHMGRLLTTVAQAAGQDPATFVQQWLAQLASNNKPLSQQWPTDASGKPDLTRPPVQLLAIANRLDLRDPNQNELGELRFVFGTIPTGQIANPNNFLLFENDIKVILEFKVPNTYISAQEWAVGWHALGDASLTDTTFGNTLQNLTESVVEQSKPTLLRIRVVNNTTNQNWTFQQFQINAQETLVPTPLNSTPDASFAGPSFLNGSTSTAAELQQWVSSNSQAILQGTYVVPQNLLATSLTMPLDYGPNASALSLRSWPLTGVDTRTAAIFNVNSCNGCHGVGGPGLMPIPFQVSNRIGAGSAAQLSLFLTGTPDGQYNELARRAADMEQVLCGNADNSAGPSVVMPND